MKHQLTGFIPQLGCGDLLVKELDIIATLEQLERPAENFATLSLGPSKPLSLAFAAQVLPNCTLVEAASISNWAQLIFEQLQQNQTIYADYNARLDIFDLSCLAKNKQPRRCLLIRQAVEDLLKKKLRSLTKHKATTTLLVQLALKSPTAGYLSIMKPEDLVLFRHCLSQCPAGHALIAEDKFPPSRAYRKLIEAELHYGKKICSQDNCIELGAAPGGWSAIVLARGAKLTAIDRAPLRADLMKNPNLTFIKSDGFSYQPQQKVDWLLCDMIAYPQRNLELLQFWMSKKLCKSFLMTFKFKGQFDFDFLSTLKSCLEQHSQNFLLRKLENNKNELTAIGEVN